MRQQILNY